jgi:NAD(P)-dependent dehydrogenase (short-subunit alcohol dehydrogenase family)
MTNCSQDKVVLIAGGAKNLGGLLSRTFAHDGARAVVVHHHGESSAEDANKTAEDVRASGAQALIVTAEGQVALWKMMPRTCRCPEWTALTPCRMATLR